MFKEVEAFVQGQQDVGFVKRVVKRGSIKFQVNKLKERLDSSSDMFQVKLSYLTCSVSLM